MEPQDVFKFCPRCRTELTQEKHKVRCAKCGLVHYINPIPCNAVIITNENNEILMVERKIEPLSGMWDLPGGFVDVAENIEDSVRRETFEELGVHLYELKYLMSSHDRYSFKGIRDYTLGVIFTARIEPGETPCAADDAKSFRFFKKEELPWEKIAFASIKVVLKAYLDSLNS